MQLPQGKALNTAHLQLIRQQQLQQHQQQQQQQASSPQMKAVGKTQVQQLPTRYVCVASRSRSLKELLVFTRD